MSNNERPTYTYDVVFKDRYWTAHRLEKWAAHDGAADMNDIMLVTVVAHNQSEAMELACKRMLSVMNIPEERIVHVKDVKTDGVTTTVITTDAVSVVGQDWQCVDIKRYNVAKSTPTKQRKANYETYVEARTDAQKKRAARRAAQKLKKQAAKEAAKAA